MGASSSKNSGKTQKYQPQIQAHQERTRHQFFLDILNSLINTKDMIDLTSIVTNTEGERVFSRENFKKATESRPPSFTTYSKPLEFDCGDYVMLSPSDLAKNFHKIKISSVNGRSIHDVLFAPSDVVEKKSLASKANCRSIAIFYIRLIQFVSALTMSVYSPPDLISRIIKNTYETQLKAQEKLKPKTREQEEENKSAKKQFLKDKIKFIVEQGNKTMRNAWAYDEVRNLMKFTYEKKIYKFGAEIYNADEKYRQTNIKELDPGYWIEFKTINKTLLVLYFTKTSANDIIYMFSPDKQEDKYVIVKYVEKIKNAAEELASVVVNEVVPEIVPEEPKRRNIYGNYEGGQRKTSKLRYNKNRKTIRSVKIMRGGNIDLPDVFKSFFIYIKDVYKNIENTSDSSPSAYRTALLYTPSIVDSRPSSYICVDKWAGSRLGEIPAFKTLESLYYLRDDGSIPSNNKNVLSEFTKNLCDIYGLQFTPNVNLLDITVPSLYSPSIQKVCENKLPHGNILLNGVQQNILKSAQDKIMEQYENHEIQTYNIMTKLFTYTSKPDGSKKLNFTEDFMNSPTGARRFLENEIVNAIVLIQENYLHVEGLYFDAIANLVRSYQQAT